MPDHSTDSDDQKRVGINVQVPQAMRQQFRLASLKNNESMQLILLHAIEQYIADNSGKENSND